MNALRSLICLLFISLAIGGCERDGVRMEESKQRTFASADEAARAAKDDLVSILRGADAPAAGVDAATVERSEPGPPARRVDVSFEKLLSAPATGGLAELAIGERSTVVPLLVDGDVVTIVEVRQGTTGWQIVGLADRGLAEDLTAVRRALGDQRDAPITIYDVPNLQVTIYAVTRDGAEVLFTDYGGRFSVREGIAAAPVVSLLRTDAIAFQARYGDLLKKERLLR